jgi:hypothetical protein
MIMANEESKLKRSERLHRKESHIAKQMNIRKAHNFPVDSSSPHRYHKVSGTTCGDSNCVMCGNPRKFFNEPTIQERRFSQKETFVEDND